MDDGEIGDYDALNERAFCKRKFVGSCKNDLLAGGLWIGPGGGPFLSVFPDHSHGFGDSAGAA